jgi:hypothetical protein
MLNYTKSLYSHRQTIMVNILIDTGIEDCDFKSASQDKFHSYNHRLFPVEQPDKLFDDNCPSTTVPPPNQHNTSHLVLEDKTLSLIASISSKTEIPT